MFDIKTLIETSLDNLHNLLKYFIDRDDLKLYQVVIETNNFGNFTVRRDLESIYVEHEYFEDCLRFVKTYKFNNINEALDFINKYSDDIISEFEIKITITNFEEINDIIAELKTFNPIILQVTQEIIIYEEFIN